MCILITVRIERMFVKSLPMRCTGLGASAIKVPGFMICL